MLCEKIKVRDILDYGCGKQNLKTALPDHDVTGYDPCIEGRDGRPAPHSFVYCGDVLEHVEPDCVDAVLTDIKDLTQHAALLVTNSEPAVKVLSDGRNAHLVQKPMWWWSEKISNKFKIITYEYRRGDHLFFVRPIETTIMRWDWLYSLSRENGWHRGAELGVKEGRFSIFLARYGIEMTAVDLWAPRPEMRDVPGGETYEDWNHDKLFNSFKALARGLPIRILREDTREAYKGMGNGWFDFIFIDADHSYDGVKTDIENWRSKVRAGGFMGGHDFDLDTVKRAVTDSFPGANIIEGPNKCWGVFLP